MALVCTLHPWGNHSLIAIGLSVKVHNLYGGCFIFGESILDDGVEFLYVADLQELLMERSVLALVNGEPWDMHRPLVEDCTLQFLHFKDEDPTVCNEVSNGTV